MGFLKRHKPFCFSVSAFSVIESIIIITVIGILVAVALPRMDTFYIIKFQGALRKLISDVRYAQNMAVSRHASTRLDFDSALNKYEGTLCAGSCGVPANWVDMTDPFSRSALAVDYNSDSQYQGIDITAVNFAATSALRFNWEGLPQNSAGADLTSNGTISLSYHGETATLTVVARTGKVEVNTSF